MVIINRTRKDSCNNASVLLPLIHSHDVQSGAANARCKLGQSRAAPQCTPTLLNKQQAMSGLELFHTDTEYSTLILGVFPFD